MISICGRIATGVQFRSSERRTGNRVACKIAAIWHRRNASDRNTANSPSNPVSRSHRQTFAVESRRACNSPTCSRRRPLSSIDDRADLSAVGDSLQRGCHNICAPTIVRNVSRFDSRSRTIALYARQLHGHAANKLTREGPEGSPPI